MSCTFAPTATPSAQPINIVSTSSATLAIASNSALAYGIHDTVFVLWTGLAILIFVAMFFVGTYMFRK
jgi:hypothetical protein